ncbi:uncharacterized protein LY79DRAFT_567908 [Colletotrichum navitas]|uniref:Uncharacterized protein n=1 Tax=Colletotrichum navitas TaxID=681940 RepID=A0AAD8PP35_9PEZI|nr:uncharacterized protein LY79DRAFT_567908 [Colletotrichum navitas]KAK1573775.1 hypothetical protein LY79DRAFT_567908 [Colletotrichum navitas]
MPTRTHIRAHTQLAPSNEGVSSTRLPAVGFGKSSLALPHRLSHYQPDPTALHVSSTGLRNPPPPPHASHFRALTSRTIPLEDGGGRTAGQLAHTVYFVNAVGIHVPPYPSPPESTHAQRPPSR